MHVFILGNILAFSVVVGCHSWPYGPNQEANVKRKQISFFKFSSLSALDAKTYVSVIDGEMMF